MRFIEQHVHEDSRLVTDKASALQVPAGRPATKAWTIPNTNGRAATFTPTPLEGFFSIFKRGLIGVYQHMDAKHLDRYLAEFDFRQNTRAKLGINDEQRAALAVKGMKGKRLTYQTVGI